jgi:hypothetical protein
VTGYEITESSIYQTSSTNYGAGWRAFNRNTNYHWHYDNTRDHYNGDPYEWLAIKLPQARAATTIAWTGRTVGNDAVSQTPTTFQIQACNDGVSWKDLLAVTNGQKGANSQFTYYALNNTTNYLYYRVYIYKTMWEGDSNWDLWSTTSNGNYPILCRVCLFGM